MKNPSRTEYEHRMHKVVAYVDAHLDQALTLPQLASVAHFSPFHFHRLFAAWMGETLGDYLRRRRVETAAMRLAAQPRLSVLTAAIDVGFGSGEAFTRAFRQHFKQSPTAWRKLAASTRAAQRNYSQALRNIDQVNVTGVQDTGNSIQAPEHAMQVTLIDRKPTTIAYLRYTGPAGEPVSQFWQTVYFPWAATHGLLDKPRYGISHSDPAITAADKWQYDACVEVPADFVPSGAASLATIPGGRYAALAFTGTASQFEEGWQTLLRDWLPDSGLQLDARPSFEYYGPLSTYNPATGVLTCDICVPVAPL